MILNANFLTGSLCGVERQHRGLFHYGIYRRKKIKKQNKKQKKQADMALPVSMKVGLGNNFPSLTFDVVPRVRRINRTNKQTNNLSVLCEHCITMDHIISWTEAKILELETDYRKRLSIESWHINAKPHVMNRNDGNIFPAVCLDLLKL